MQATLGKDYLDVKIDTKRMEHGAEVAARLRKERGGGIPWMVILDAEGKELVTSDGPEGNCGCPVTPEEVAWFLTMIRKTSRHMDAKDQEALKAALESFAEKLRRPR